MNRSQAAFLFACALLGKEKLYMWTFTFAELLAVKETRKKWNHLRTLLLQTWPELRGLRVFELHKEHGLHVHLVTNQFIDVNQARILAEQAGWGRIHVTPMPAEHVGYLAKYLSKKRPECLKRWRLWDSFGEGGTPPRSRTWKSKACSVRFTAHARNGRDGKGAATFSCEWILPGACSSSPSRTAGSPASARTINPTGCAQMRNWISMARCVMRRFECQIGFFPLTARAASSNCGPEKRKSQ